MFNNCNFSYEDMFYIFTTVFSYIVIHNVFIQQRPGMDASPEELQLTNTLISTYICLQLHYGVLQTLNIYIQLIDAK